MFIRSSGLSVKITGMLLGFFLVALAAIATTLFISWHLEGAAAAINDAGSLRMRVYSLAHRLARAELDTVDRAAFAADLTLRVAKFDEVLEVLRRGDPTRPLAVPREEGIREALDHLADEWVHRLRPILIEAANAPDRRIGRPRCRLPARNGLHQGRVSLRACACTPGSRSRTTASAA